MNNLFIHKNPIAFTQLYRAERDLEIFCSKQKKHKNINQLLVTVAVIVAIVIVVPLASLLTFVIPFQQQILSNLFLGMGCSASCSNLPFKIISYIFELVLCAASACFYGSGTILVSAVIQKLNRSLSALKFVNFY